MGKIDRRLKTELGSLPSPEPRPAHVDETAALCLKAYRARRRMSRLSVTGLIAGQLRFVAAPIWAAQAAAVLCMCLVLGLAMRSEDFAADAPALLGMFSVFVAMSALPFYGRSRKYKMRELESSTKLSSRRLLLAKLSAVGAGDAACLTALSLTGGLAGAANAALGLVVLPFLLACTGMLLILEHSGEEHGLHAALGFGFGLAAALWIFRTELGELCAELGTAPAAAVCAALLAALALECRQLLRQLPARDMQQALSY